MLSHDVEVVLTQLASEFGVAFAVKYHDLYGIVHARFPIGGNADRSPPSAADQTLDHVGGAFWNAHRHRTARITKLADTVITCTSATSGKSA